MKKELDSKKMLVIAKKAVLRAGEHLLRSRESCLRVTRERKKDIKIQADVQSEKIIIDYLQRNTDFSILSEEKGFISGNSKGIRWIIDPLDGSFNFLRGIPLCCISVGLWDNDIPLLGVVYEFNRSELFSGIVNEGSWLNNKSIRVSGINKINKSVLCTGFPVNIDFSTKAMLKYVEDFRAFKKIRMIGSAALSIVYVASGRADVYKEKNIMLWDVAGAIPVLLGAGGKLKIGHAVKKNSFDICAYNGILEID